MAQEREKKNYAKASKSVSKQAKKRKKITKQSFSQ